MISLKKLFILMMIAFILISQAPMPVAFALTMQELAAKDSDSWQAYISISHDSLLRIAAIYSLDANLLAQINNVRPDQILAAGHLLWLPLPKTPQTTVKSGDTLYSLAKEHDLSLNQISDYNNINSNSTLYIGQVLRLANTKPIANQTALTILNKDFIWPSLGVISSPFGPRDGGWHYGLDIAAPKGQNIVAAKDGQIILAEWKSDAYGYTVMIDHGNNQYSLYAHCSELLVSSGQQVAQGDTIARIGSTGNSTGPHLHFEIRENGVCYDPLTYL